jgi:DNA topoisomerase-1
MTKLVIVESPAKCSKIQGYLGQGWKVIATMGHIRALEEDLKAVGLDNDFEPTYRFLKEKDKALKQLKDSAKGCDEIYLASDDDREGESISFAVCEYLKLNPKTTPRAVFHEITQKAVRAAVENPRKLDMNRVMAQQSRAMLDMMIGFTMSPLLWGHVAPSLSAGRCQTPALRIVVERENDIATFQTSSFWKVTGEWTKNIQAELEDELEDEESALSYLEIMSERPRTTILTNEVKQWSSSPPLPLITSTLQQQASALFGIGPKVTMQIAQKLYEAGHITYMRTDKAVLSDDAKEDAKTKVKELYGQEYIGEEKVTKKSQNQAKEGDVKAQEAHEAIRPTHMEVQSLEDCDDGLHRKIYALIWQRAIQSVMANAKGETCKIRFKAEEDDFIWIAQTRRTTFQGWQIAGKVAQIDEEDEESNSSDSEWSIYTSLKPGMDITWNSISANPHESRTPPRYTEATLVRELEKHGIGRPSTFASLLGAIQDKGYAEIKDITGKKIDIPTYKMTDVYPPVKTIVKKAVGQEKKKLVPTELGKSVLSFLLKNFDDIFDYGFTASMEQRLDRVSDGEEQWKDVLRDTWSAYKERYYVLKKEPSIKAKEGGSAKVKEFGEGLKAVMSKKGPLLLIEHDDGSPTEFLGWPEGVVFQDITEEQAKSFKKPGSSVAPVEPIGEWNGEKVYKKNGKFGWYAEAGTVRVSVEENDTLETVIEKLGGKSALKKFKEYEIRSGQYGPYIFKPALKNRQFVSIPKNINVDTLTENDVSALYKSGLEAKAKAKTAPFKKRDSKK